MHARFWWIGPRISDTTHAHRSRDIDSRADPAGAEGGCSGPGGGARYRVGGLRRPACTYPRCTSHGGRPGLVLKPEPMAAAIDAATARQPAGSPRIYMSAQGVPFTQVLAQEFS